MAKYKNISENQLPITYADKSSLVISPGEEFLYSPLLAKRLLEQGLIEEIAIEPPAKKSRNKGVATDGLPSNP